MDSATTLSLAIHCASCNAGFRARLASGARSAWRQRSVPGEEGQLLTAYLCDRCAARFGTESAAMEFLHSVLARKG